MSRYKVVVLFLFIFQLCFPQLSLKPSANQDHFLYIKGNVLFVQGDLKLEKNKTAGREASLYLREDAHLIQGSQQQKNNNTGSGSISIFQEGTSNAFDYNYWSSPVVSPENSFFGITLLHDPQSESISHPAGITAALNGSANPLTISNRWIYTFSGNDYTGWNYVGAATTIPPGYGFSMKGTDGKDPTLIEGKENNPGGAQRYDFRGKANSGLIEIPVTSQGMILVGNPYPSALDLSRFLLENSGGNPVNSQCSDGFERKNIITGVAYFWDSGDAGSSHYVDEYIGGYGSFTPVDPCTAGLYQKAVFKAAASEESKNAGKHYDRRFAPVGQGFMVEAVNSGTITFKNAHRIFRKKGDFSDFKLRENSSKKSVEKPVEIPQLEILITINQEYVRGLRLAFWPRSTAGADAGMDAATYDLQSADVGWLLENESFVIQVRPFAPNDQVPIFLVAEEKRSSFSFSLGEIRSGDVKNLFILDTQTNIRHPITASAFEIELDPGTYHGRFELVYSEAPQVLDLPVLLPETDPAIEEFSIFHNNRTRELEILGNSFSAIKSVAVFDLNGKKLFSRANFPNTRSVSISTAHWANELYIVKVTGMNDQKMNKKIMVYKHLN